MKKIIIIVSALIFLAAGAAAVLISYLWPKAEVSVINEESTMILSSTVFTNFGNLPEKYTCNGDRINPPLDIAGVPDNAASLVLTIEDPDAPVGTFIHWTVWNIKPDAKEIAENSVPSGGVQGITSVNKLGYVPPCPPSGMHRYIFTVYALDALLDLPASARIKDIARAMEGHIVDKAEMTGLYGAR